MGAIAKMLTLKNLSLSFVKKEKGAIKEQTNAVRELSFNLKRGECIAIVGESGCGKSASLLSVLALHNGQVMQGGEVFFEGKPIHNYSDKQMQAIRGKRIALICQDPMSALNPTMKVGVQIAEGLNAEKYPSKADKNRQVIRLLEETGIKNPEIRAQQYPFEFSGGMLQRVAIAIAIAGEPDIILADEPTTALDVTVQKQVLDLIKALQVKNNMALVLVSHDLAVVSTMADKVLVMYAGELFEEANISDIFSKPEHPYTQALLNALPNFSGVEGENSKTLNTIEGQPPDLSQNIPACAFVDRCPKAMNICAKEKPPIFNLADRHSVRCWLASPENQLNSVTDKSKVDQ